MTGPRASETPDAPPGGIELDEVETQVHDLAHDWDPSGEQLTDLLDRVCSTLAEQASHELRQILTMVSAELELADHRSSGDGVRLEPERLDELLAVLDRGAQVTETLLDRNEVAKLLIHLDRAPTDLTALVPEVLDHRGIDADRDEIDLDVEPATVDADREKLTRVLGLLVSSLWQARPPEGSLTVQVEPAQHEARGFVALAPCPIPRNRLVEKLQADLDLEGLEVDFPYARAVVERHGGSLYVDARNETLGYAFTLPLEVPR